MKTRLLPRWLVPVLAVLLAFSTYATSTVQAQPTTRSRIDLASTQVLNASKYGATASDTVGSTNAVALQTALNVANVRGGGVVYVDVPGIYIVNGAVKGDTATDNYRLECCLVIYSNTTLLMADGVTLKAATNNNCYFLRNYASGTGTTGTLSTYDRNIAVSGGKFDFNYANQSGTNARGAKYWKGQGNWFDYIDGLTLSGTEYTNGLKFLNWFTHINRLRVLDCRSYVSNSDFLHVGSGCNDIKMDGIYATGGGDNPIAGVDNEGYYYPDLSPADRKFDSPHDAPITNWTISNCYFPSNTFDVIRLVATQGMSNVSIENVRGDTSNGFAITIIDDPAGPPALAGGKISGISVRNCNIKTASAGYMIRADAFGFTDILIDGCINPDQGANLSIPMTVTSGSFTVGEVITESVSGAKGTFVSEGGGFINILPYDGSAGWITGSNTRTLTGSGGAVRTETGGVATAAGQSLFKLGPRCYNTARVRLSNVIDERAYRGSIYLEQGTVATLDATTAGGNTTAFQVNEVVTESGSGATGKFIKEANGKLYILVSSGTFTGTASRTLTGGTSGGIRVGSNYVAIISPVCPSLMVSNSTFTLGADGRALHIAGTCTLTMRGCTVYGSGAAHSSDAAFRIDAGASFVGTVGDCVFANLGRVIDQSTTTEAKFNLVGNTLAGYANNTSYIIENRAAACKTSIVGSGNMYTDTSLWNTNGILTVNTGAGYTRVDDESLRFRGDFVATNLAAAWAWNKFYNTYTSGSGAWQTLGTGGVGVGTGPVIYNADSSAWKTNGR